MALSSAGGGGTTIAKTASGGADLHTVPAGKTFEGHMWNNSSSGIGYINGTRLYWPYYSNYFAQNYLPVTLNGGDVVKSDNSGTTMLLGVEK